MKYSCYILVLLWIYSCLGYKFAWYNVENKQEKNIAITFDDGPHGTLTPRLLDELKKRNAKVTFYVMGVKVQYHGDILRRAISEGHEIGNHVWNHPVISRITLDQLHQQVADTSTAIFNATNYMPRTIRPPYGNTNNGINKYLSEKEGLEVVLWSLDTVDWKRPKPDVIVSRVLKHVKPGTILLCHDVHPGTIEAIPVLVDALQGQGYNIITVSDMIQRSKKAVASV